MANVNTYLAQILSATYGEEVRSAIHDSINAMNIESSNAMEYARTAQDSAAASATAAGESATTALGAKADALLAAGNAIAAESSIDAKVADVMTMKSNLILNHAIYQELYDSNSNVLLDSTEGSILGEVIFSDVEDVTRLHKRINDLETIINQLASLLINNRLVIVETSMTEANESITRINEHALFDSTFI